VDQRRGGIECGLHVDHRLELFDVDLQHLQRVFGLLARFGNDGHHRLALPAGAVHRQRVLRRRLHAGQVAQHRHPGLADPGQVVSVGHQDHAGHAACGCGVDALDAAVRHRAAPVHHVRHARQLDVVDVGALALHQLARARALDALADVARVFGQVVQRLVGRVGRVSGGPLLHLGAGVDDVVHLVQRARVHALTLLAFLARSARVSQIASTMAW
jgi:hypothetical protein